MSIAERSAQTSWVGSLATGTGVISPASAAFDPLPVTWAARTEAPGGKTSPEELAAAAHSSCFAMALSLCLGKRKVEANRLDVSDLAAVRGGHHHRDGNPGPGIGRVGHGGCADRRPCLRRDRAGRQTGRDHLARPGARTGS